MNTIKTFISTVALLTASTLFAQSGSCITFPKGEDGPGVIGKRYAEVGFVSQDFHQYSDVAQGPVVAANVPLAKGLDVGMAYSYSTLNYTPMGAPSTVVVDSTAHNFGINALVYNTIEGGIKPFLSCNLGTTAATASYLGSDHSTNYQWWGFSAGAEFPSKWVSVIASIGYDDDFRGSSDSTQNWNAKVEVNTWITSRIGVYVGAAYIRPLHDDLVTSNVWSAGARVRF
jgi:hypothetical protein